MAKSIDTGIIQFRIVDKKTKSGNDSRARITQLIEYLRNPDFNKNLMNAKSTEQLEFFQKYFIELSNYLIPDEWIDIDGYKKHLKCLRKLRRITRYKLRHFREKLLIMTTVYLGFKIKDGKGHIIDQLVSRCATYRELHHKGNYNLKEIRQSIYNQFKDCLEHPEISKNKLLMCVGIYCELGYLIEYDLNKPFCYKSELLNDILTITDTVKSNGFANNDSSFNDDLRSNYKGKYHLSEDDPVEEYFHLPSDELMTDEQFNNIKPESFN